MKYKSAGDFNVDPQDVSTMPQYPPQLHRLKLCARSIPRRYYWLLFTSTFLSMLFFSFAVRSNSRSVYALLTSFFASSPAATSNNNPSSLPSSQTLSMHDQNIVYTDYNYLDNSTLTFEKRTYGDQPPVFFRLPKKVPIWALLLIFHGCSRSAYDWFSTIERQRIVGAAIDLGYGCIAFQSTDDFSRCWSSEIDFTNNPDAQMVWSALDGFYKEHPKLKSLPRFTFGASSGGMFSSVFATNSKYAVQGQIIFISVVRPNLLQTHVKAGKYPPTAWIYMTGDTEFASEVRINDSMKVFAEENIPHIAYAIQPLSVTLTTFHERIPTITEETSAAILHALREHSWLDSQSHLKSNPRRTNTWPEFLSAVVNKTITSTSVLDNLERHRTVLPDFLNTIYGQHEISFERSFEALQWHKQIWNKNSHSAMSPST